MADILHVFNSSRNLDTDILAEVLIDLAGLRDIKLPPVSGAEQLLGKVVEHAYDQSRDQVNADKAIEDIHRRLASLVGSGKILLIDEDMYSERANEWCFGGYVSSSGDLGYLLISTARMQDGPLARNVLGHEIGHMFGAPSNGRSNTAESLGLHCTSPLCVMQQNLTVKAASEHAHRMAAASSPLYCPLCMEDIANYVPPE